MSGYGVILNGMECFTTPGEHNPGGVIPIATWEVTEGPALVHGNEADIHAHMTNQRYVQGSRIQTFFEDFYFRIYLIPPNLEFGTITADKTITMTIWNSYLTPVQFTSSTPIFGDSVHQGGPALPFNFGALQQVGFPFTADKEGETILSDGFTFVFDNGDIKFVQVSGFRQPPPADLIFPFPPNWASGFEIGYEFKTAIIESEHGDEQRRQLRQTPRKNYGYTVHLQNNAHRLQYNSLMKKNQSQRFYIPELPRWTTLAGPLNETELVVQLSSVPYWVTPDAYVMLNYNGRYAMRRVDFLGSDSNSETDIVTFVDADDFVWPAGTKVHPAIVCWVGDEVTAQRVTNWVHTVSMRFDSVPGEEVAPPIVPAPLTFDGRELWDRKPNWAEPMDATKVWITQKQDYEVGRALRHVNINFGKDRFVFNYVGRTVADADLLKQFFHRNAGRCREFYMSTWQPDIFPQFGWTADENLIQIEGGDFAATYGEDRTRSAISVLLDDGTTHMCVIDRIFADLDSNGVATSFIQFLEPLGFDVLDLMDVDKISWVSLWRMSSDEMLETWLTDSVCNVSFTFEELPRNRPDIDDSNSGSTT